MAETRLNVCVTPRSGRDEVSGLVQGPNGTEVRVRVTAAPDKGKANASVCKVVAQELGVPKTSVTVASGQTSHHKVLSVPLSRAIVPSSVTVV